MRTVTIRMATRYFKACRFLNRERDFHISNTAKVYYPSWYFSLSRSYFILFLSFYYFCVLTGMAVVVDIVPALGDRCRAGKFTGDALLTIVMVAEPLLVLTGHQRVLRIGRMSTLDTGVAHASR